MKLVNPQIEILKQEPGIQGLFKQIEIAGRTCYKSEDKITEDSAEQFVERMIKSNHTAMLEHGTLYLDVPMGTPVTDKYYIVKSSIVQFFKNNKYSKVNEYDTVDEDANGIKTMISRYAITTNYRVFIEQVPWDKLGKIRVGTINNIIVGLDKDYVLSFMCSPNEHHEQRYTFKVITDRAVAQEFTRHRVLSYAMESQRYCNYGKDKFGKEITFVEPYWYADAPVLQRGQFDLACRRAERTYFLLLNDGLSPQAARCVLPNCTKTEFVVTGFSKDWQHFIDLRSEGTTGVPHPDMKIVGDKIKELFNNL